MRRSLLVLCALAAGCSSTPSPRSLIILHTNDEHSHLLGLGPEQDDFPPVKASGSIKGGIGRRMTVLQTERAAATAAGAAHLTVSAGDNMMGSLTQIRSVFDAPDFRLMGPKYLNYDVTTLGNHEFDWGPFALAAIIGTAGASSERLPPIVTSNIHFSGDPNATDAALAALFDDFGSNPGAPMHRALVVTASNGLRVGFVGILGADAAVRAPFKAPVTFSVAPGQSEQNQLSSLAQIFSDLQPVVDRLHREQRPDLVVALSHGGLDPGNPAKSEDFAIAQSVSGIDVIVSGHSHTEASAMVVNRSSGKNVYVQQAGRYGDNVGRIKLSVDSGGNVTFDTAASQLVKVDDSTAVSDSGVNSFISDIVGKLETTPVATGKPSFLGFTLYEILGAPPAAPDAPGKLYNYGLGELDFDIDASSKYQETALQDLVVDSLLAAATNGTGLKPGDVDLSLEGYGDIRVAKVQKSSKPGSQVGFADLFDVVSLGITSAISGPSALTPGYPLCYVGVYLAEVKAGLELTASYAYAGHDDLFVVPAGFKFEYDVARQPFNPNGDPLDKNNGRVTKISKLSPADLVAGNYDGTYIPVFDANISPSISPTGWLANPLGLVRVAASLYLTTFASFAGVHLKDPVTGAPIANNDARQTILHRADGTEIKAWEALGAYVHAQAAANGGKLPSRYDKTASTTVLPRRAVCVSAKAVGGNCGL